MEYVYVYKIFFIYIFRDFITLSTLSKKLTAVWIFSFEQIFFKMIYLFSSTKW